MPAAGAAATPDAPVPARAGELAAPAPLAAVADGIEAAPMAVAARAPEALLPVPPAVEPGPVDAAPAARGAEAAATGGVGAANLR